MNIRSVELLVAEILTANHLPFESDEYGLSLRFDSCLVRVKFETHGEQVIVELRSRLLRDIHDAAAKEPQILTSLNELNERNRFVKWVFNRQESAIVLEYDLLGDHLQEAEVMTALAIVARLADGTDDRLQAQFGGRKAFE